MAKKPRAEDHPPGVDENGVLVDPQAYIWDLLRRSPGQSALDWKRVLGDSGLPPGNPPNIKPRDNGFYGITQQIGADGPRGQIFLPTATQDALGYYAHTINLLQNSGGDCSQNPKFCIWEWRDEQGGPPYHPINAGEDYVPPAGGGTSPPQEAGVSKDEVQAMIDAAMANAVKVGDKIALRTNSGMIAGIKGGGPTSENAPIDLIGKSNIDAWESFKVEKGQ